MSAPERLEQVLAAVLPDAHAARHHLHHNPELSRNEAETARFVASKLREYGIENIRENVGGNGVVAELRGRGEGKTVALRGDMDALPIQEENDLPYKSCRAGVMHACGHDGHTANLLGTAAALAKLRDELPGTVRFLFQPAEEIVEGAAAMCKEGAMDGVDYVFGLHGWPGLEVGQVAVRQGAMMASSDTFVLDVFGSGGHAAQPHVTIDPILVGAHLVTALQALVSREVNPTDSVVVTVAQFHAGTADNVIPETARLEGTVRCLTESRRKEMPERIERVVAGVCSAFRARHNLAYRFGTGVTTNDAAMTNLFTEVACETLGANNVIALDAPSMGAEDFSVYLSHAPGCFFRLGVGADSPPIHTPRYNFGDAPLPIGIKLFTRLAFAALRTN
jgi:amidohydrolase